MKGIIDKGTGTAIVLIPGLQGRWEWMRPTVDALAKHHRVITFSLCDERTSAFPCDPEKAFENYVEQVELALDRAGIDTAIIVGVSYGGLIASEFAARRPRRVSGLVLASAVHQTWRPDMRQLRFLRAPRLLLPLFLATAPGRMNPELAAAIPRTSDRLRFKARQGAYVALAPASPSRMARRIAWATAHHYADPHRVQAPTLVVTGEAALDRILPVDVTRRYLDDLDSAQHVVLKHTGHLGSVTRPEEFAAVLGRFVDGIRRAA